MSFPRGGGSNKGVKSPGAKVDQDALFGSKKRLARIEDRSSARDGKKAKVEVASLAQAIGAGMTKQLTGSATLKVESMVFNKYQPGCQALGFVLQIMSDRAVISLPGGTVGTVKISEVSDASSRLMESYEAELKHKRDAARLAGKKFNVNTVKAIKPDISVLLTPLQFVRVIVLEQVETDMTTKRRALDLSMRSSLMNKGLQIKHLQTDYPLSGCIVSKEDHGYIVSAGLAGANLFLPLKQVPALMGELEVGTYQQNQLPVFLYIVIYIVSFFKCNDDKIGTLS